MSRTHNLILLALIVTMVAIQVTSILPKSLTTDEMTHWRYGYNILMKGSSDRDRNGPMPFSVLNLILYRIGYDLDHSPTRSFLSDVMSGRYMTILFSVLVGIFVFKWSRALYGARSGLFSLTLYALSPNIIAHSRLITLDIYGAGMIVIALYYFWQFMNKGGWGRAVLSAITVALSMLAKYFCAFLYPIFAAILLIMYSRDLGDWFRRPERARMLRWLRSVVTYGVLFVAVTVLLINVGFLFNRTMTPLGEYEWTGEKAQAFKAGGSFLNRLPVPLPYPYVHGLEWGIFMEETGAGFGNPYLLGQIHEYGGFKHYYFVAFLLKVPIAVQAFIVIAVVYYLRRRHSFRFRRDEVLLLVPIIVFTVYLNFFFGMQVGIRHYLMVLPLLHIFCGSLFRDGLHVSPRLKVVSGALIAYLLISILSYHPHYISYFNEFLLDRKMAYKYLADSNVDWGQDMKYVKDYLEKHPDAVYLALRPHGMRAAKRAGEERPEFVLPDSGLIVVRVNDLVGVHKPERYRWIRENLEPVDRIAYSFLVFELDPNDGHPRRPESARSPQE